MQIQIPNAPIAPNAQATPPIVGNSAATWTAWQALLAGLPAIYDLISAYQASIASDNATNAGTMAQSITTTATPPSNL